MSQPRAPGRLREAARNRLGRAPVRGSALTVVPDLGRYTHGTRPSYRHGPTALHRHRRRRDVGHRQDPGAARGEGRGQRREGVRHRRGPAGAGRDRAHRPRGRPPGLRRHLCGGVLGDPRGQPGAGPRRRARHPGGPPLGRPRPADGRPAPDRGRGHARQDHDHVDARRVPLRAGAEPLVRDRRRPGRPRLERPARRRRDLRRRGRRIGPQLPQVRPRGRDRPQRRARPPRQLRLHRRDLRVLRDLRRQDRAGRYAGDLRGPRGRARTDPAPAAWTYGW